MPAHGAVGGDADVVVEVGPCAERGCHGCPDHCRRREKQCATSICRGFQLKQVNRPGGRDALEAKGPQRRLQRRLGRRLEEVAKAVGDGYCRLQMPLKLALGIRGTVAGHRLDVLDGGAGCLPPFQCIPVRGSRTTLFCWGGGAVERSRGRLRLCRVKEEGRGYGKELEGLEGGGGSRGCGGRCQGKPKGQPEEAGDAERCTHPKSKEWGLPHP